MADALLDKQYWAPDDPQKHPYDDTGWSFPQLFHVKTIRVTDPALLKASMAPVDLASISGKLNGSGSTYVVANTGQTSLLALMYALKSAHTAVAEKAFDVEGKHFGAGSLLITQADDASMTTALQKLHLDATRLGAMPSVATHVASAPRIAFMHSWLGTQTDGWWRLAFDRLGIPFTYISTQTAASDADLRKKYDVIVVAPVGCASTSELPPKQEPWQARALNEEQQRNNAQVIPAALRPQVILRFNDLKNLLLSGLLDKGSAVVERAIVVGAYLGTGNVLLFANNPVYRGETIGNYNLVFNAILTTTI